MSSALARGASSGGGSVPSRSARRSSYARICTAAARFSDWKAGFAGMRIIPLQSASSSLDSPLRSRPNTSATFSPAAAAAATRAAASRGVYSGQGMLRWRALLPSTSEQLRTASARVSWTFAAASRSPAPAARALASAPGNPEGRTSRRLESPMVFMARALAPMFPGCVVATRTTWTRSGMRASFDVQSDPAGPYNGRGQRQGKVIMHPMLNIGIRAARAAGDLIVRYMDRVEGLPVTSKGRNDFVSQVDREAERTIIDIIHKAYPSHAILAEESGASGRSDYTWIIDPLDGTTNFLHGFPQFAVSIAVTRHGE